MSRYSVKQVITGYIQDIDREKMKDGKIAIVEPKVAKTRICIIDKKLQIAIDMLGTNKWYPLLGRIEDSHIVTDRPINENREYALKVEDIPIPYLDKQKLISRFKEKGIIGKSKITIYHVTIGEYLSLEKTGGSYNGKTIGRLEFLMKKNCLCTFDKNSTVATELLTGKQYGILKRDEIGRLQEEQDFEQGQEYVTSIVDTLELPKRKVYRLKKEISYLLNRD